MVQIMDSTSPSENLTEVPRAMQTYVMPPRIWHETSTQTDAEVFEHAFNVLIHSNQYSSGKPLGMGIWNLESLAHDRDYGTQLMQSEPLEHLLVLARTNVGWQIRQCAARVIGSSLWNNPEAMEVARDSHLLVKLFDILKHENHSGVKASLIFAMSAAAHVSADDLDQFMDEAGSQYLRESFEHGNAEVKGKCATFVQDNLLHTFNVEKRAQEMPEWCNTLQRSLINDTADGAAEKVLECLM